MRAPHDGTVLVNDLPAKSAIVELIVATRSLFGSNCVSFNMFPMEFVSLLMVSATHIIDSVN